MFQWVDLQRHTNAVLATSSGCLWSAVFGSLSLSLFVCMCVCVCVCVCARAGTHVCLCLCLYVCVSVSVLGKGSDDTGHFQHLRTLGGCSACVGGWMAYRSAVDKSKGDCWESLLWELTCTHHNLTLGSLAWCLSVCLSVSKPDNNTHCLHLSFVVCVLQTGSHIMYPSVAWNSLFIDFVLMASFCLTVPTD